MKALQVQIYSVFACLVLFCGILPVDQAQAQWLQWGGPNRDFTVETKGLADSWPEDGPRRIWQREFGAGYSAIACDGDMLYTMYRKNYTDKVEYIVALDAKTGGELWSYKIDAPLDEPPDARWGGQGPNSTPLIIGDRLYAISSLVVLHCLDKKTGDVIWKHDLVDEYQARPDPHAGHSCSPIAYKNMIITTADHKSAERAGQDQDQHEGPTDRVIEKIEQTGPMPGSMLMAFDQKTGKLVWKGFNLETQYSSPILINFAGRDQLVLLTQDGMIGVDPNDGGLLWHHPAAGGCMTPLWDGEDTLFYSVVGQRNVGQGIRLVERDGRIVPEEVWSNRKVRVQLPTPVKVDDYFCCSTDRILLGVDIKTGKRIWAERGFASANCIYAGGKLITLDENGNLALCTPTRDGLSIHSKCKITERYSLTAPTLVGTTLYVRDRVNIMALDLGMAAK